MKLIGITGGVGSGKSEILKHLEKNPRFLVREADKIAHGFLEPGSGTFDNIVEVLGSDVLSKEGQIDKVKMAEKIYADPGLREKINEIIHPAVREYITEDIKKAGESGKYDLYFLEAALLIECGYDKICGELWYIYADPKVRKERLETGRGYSDEKTESIMKSQLDDSIYRKYCAHVIDNSGELKDSLSEIDRLTDEILD